MNGQSPLVAHYLRQKNLDYASGTDVLAQRTELQDLDIDGKNDEWTSMYAGRDAE